MTARTDNKHIEQFMGITMLKNSHRAVRQLKREAVTPTHHGHKVWHSSLLLMDYFMENPLPEGCRVLEIGCGWGLTGIFLARQFDCDVTALDIDKNVFPFLQLHADINGVDVETVKKSYASLNEGFLKTFDVVVGGDICFWDELTDKLYGLSRKAVKASARVVVSDPGRRPFLDLVERCEQRFDVACHAREVESGKVYGGYVMDLAV